jgi:hypothetical protein
MPEGMLSKMAHNSRETVYRARGVCCRCRCRGTRDGVEGRGGCGDGECGLKRKVSGSSVRCKVEDFGEYHLDGVFRRVVPIVDGAINV